jgi:hypothetical protein
MLLEWFVPTGFSLNMLLKWVTSTTCLVNKLSKWVAFFNFIHKKSLGLVKTG